MTKSKTTKRALLLSALSLLICVSMLVGSTFAWFTDSVTSAGNIIKSGTLDVTMDWAEGTEDPASASWTDASTGAIFNYDLWEPGYAEVRHVRIANAGNLALKYQLNIIANGEVSKLADVIDVYYVDPAVQVADRAALAGAPKLGTLAQVLNQVSTTASGSLLAGESDVITIALKMQESAGNEYQDLSIGADFAVQVLATQYTYEEDSFDDQYDFEAEFINKNADGAYEIASVGQLYYLSQSVDAGNSYAGEKFVLTADIDLQNNNWMPIGSWELPFSGEFDGQGHTIKNLKINEPTGEEVGLFGYTKGATIKGITVENVDIYGYSQIGTIAGMPYTGTTIADCHVKGDISIVAEYAYVGGIAGYGYLKVEDCSLIADAAKPAVIKSNTRNAVGGITAWVLEGSSFYVKNCTVENANLTGWANVGSISGFIHYGNEVSGCSVKNVVLTKTREGANPSIGALFGGWSSNTSNPTIVANNTVDNVTMNGNAKAYDYAKKAYYGSEYGGSTVDSINDATGNVYTNIKNNILLFTSVTAPGTDKVANGQALADTINNSTDAALISLGDGEYKMPSINGNKEVTIVGTEDTVIDVTLGAYMEHSKVSFEGVTIKTSTGKANGNGSDYAALYTPNVTYTDCTFVGPLRVGRDGAKFINCTFTELGNDYIWTYGQDVTFEGCTFNTDGKAILVYSDGGNEVSKVTVKNCTFNSTKGAKAGAIANQNCAAIEIHNYGNGVDLVTAGNTYDANFSGEWRIKTYETGKTKIFVNGTEYTTIALDGKTMTIDANKNVTVND